MNDKIQFQATSLVMQLNDKLEELEHLRQQILFLYKKLETLTTESDSDTIA